ncbi:hypothetical protein UT300007_17180 [Clostridium sp. CTA-7]
MNKLMQILVFLIITVFLIFNPISLTGINNNLVKAETITDTPIANFMVVSDIHGYLDNLKNAITDAKNNNCSAIIFNGDLTESGSDSQYNSLISTVNTNIANSTLSPYYVTGNHDLRWLSGGYNEGKNRFLSKTNMPGMYYDQWINGYHFIFLASDQDLKDQATLSDTQLNWLDTKLSEDASSDKPIFIFIHQALVKTVSDTYPEQGYNKSYPDGVVQDQQLRSILSKYPQSILVTGHTHAPVTSSMNFFPSSSFKMINDGTIKQSQGLLFNIYNDKVVIQGRDFSNKSTVSSWTIKYGAPETPFDSNAYYIIKNIFSEKVMDVRGESYADGADIIQYSPNNKLNQQWKFVSTEDGYYKIVSRLTGKVVCVTNDSLDNNAKLSQCTDTGADNQLWKIEDMEGGVYKFINKKSSKIIDVPGSSTSNSTILIQYSDNNTANQFWNIKRAE